MLISTLKEPAAEYRRVIIKAAFSAPLVQLGENQVVEVFHL
jgi:hypothetical protein